jgi:signal transduction histidine kinase/CheY-like chemotaxis protein
VVHLTVPVKVSGRVIAFILAGQVFDRFPEQLLLESLARARGSGPQALWDLARRQVPVGRQLLQAYGELLSTLAESYVRANYAGILDRQRYGEILGLQAHLAEREQIEAALRDADRRKDQFLATLAHELRNPLAPMMTAVHLLQQTSGDGPGGRALATLNRQLRHMVRLVDDLLDFARITRGHIDLQRRPVRLADIIASAVETSQPEIDQRQHELVVDNTYNEMMLDVDSVRISQALSNLLTNAARYMDPGGHIRLSVCRDDETIALCVADEGVGLSSDVIGHVFDMFVRGSGSRKAAPTGLGIGLTLAKMLVEMHGGTISASSDGPGNGSKFTIRLPVTGLAAVENDDFCDEESSPTSSRRILVVEDNEDSREMLTQALELKGHEVRGVADGPSALQLTLAWRPEVVILDIGLPGMNGHELAQRLRQRSELKDVVLVALTGWGQEQDRRRSSDAGIAHHLTKPVDPDRLDRLLDTLTRH